MLCLPGVAVGDYEINDLIGKRKVVLHNTKSTRCLSQKVPKMVGAMGSTRVSYDARQCGKRRMLLYLLQEGQRN